MCLDALYQAASASNVTVHDDPPSDLEEGAIDLDGEGSEGGEEVEGRIILFRYCNNVSAM